MKKKSYLGLVAALFIMLAQSVRAENTVTIKVDSKARNEPDTTVIVLGRDNPREVQAIRGYSVEIDKFVAQNAKVRRDFIRVLSESGTRWVGWKEVTGDRNALISSLVGGTAYKRNGKVVFIGFFSKSSPDKTRNTLRYYFRPDGSLAKSVTILKSYRTGEMDNKAVVIMESYFAKDGVGLGENTDYRDPKTGKPIKPFSYNAIINIGISVFSLSRSRDLPVWDLLGK